MHYYYFHCKKKTLFKLFSVFISLNKAYVFAGRGNAKYNSTFILGRYLFNCSNNIYYNNRHISRRVNEKKKKKNTENTDTVANNNQNTLEPRPGDEVDFCW